MEFKKISTTVLAKEKGLVTRAMFELLENAGYIKKEAGKHVLTAEGKSMGGELMQSQRYGDYIVWPKNIKLSDAPAKIANKKLVTATVLGNHFELSANKINFILSELGWLKKGLKGWILTSHGKKLGGVQSEDSRTGVPYVRWPDPIVQVKVLKNSVREVKGIVDKEMVTSKVKSESVADKAQQFRTKFPADYRTADGHLVRSKAEMLIDNWLYMAEIVHAYERKLPIEEDVYCDFYLPSGKVYIEYWGYDNDSKYLSRKKKKISIYEKYGFSLIQLTDKDVINLDDILPKYLLRYGIQAY